MLWAILSLTLVNTLAVILLIVWTLKGGGGHVRDSYERLVGLKSQLDSLPELIEMRLQSQNSKNTANIQEDFSKLRETLIEKLGHFHVDLSRSLSEEFEKLRTGQEKKLDQISSKVRENLDEGFKKTNQTFQSVIERLAKIDEAQKKIDHLSQNVISLQDVLTDKKSRGIFGEVHLKQILTSVFGENNRTVYKLQHTLSNGKISDATIFLPEPVGLLCVDSKFPLENFKKMMDQKINESEKDLARKDFVKNLKKHIDDISQKYIIPGETADQAILFLPAEAIFAELHAYHSDVIDYANNKRVWITSPTTFLATLTTVQIILLNLERNKYMSVIHEEINKLGEEFSRYQSRWDNLAKHIDNVSKDVKDIHITSKKISHRFEKIHEVEIEGKQTEERLESESLNKSIR